MHSGFFAAVAAFLIWGLFPIYWKALEHVPALQIVLHRLAWCFVLVMAYLLLRKGWGWWRPLLRQPRLMGMLCVSTTLISANWFLYIWAVNHGHIVETSLGYFIGPLVNVLFGVALLGERLNRWQWLAVAVAAVGVLWLTLRLDGLPWIALGLACSFSLYGLIRKTAAVDSVPGLAVESGLLFLPSVAYLLWVTHDGSGAMGSLDWRTDALLVGAGLVTALPLALFAYGARRIPYSLVGILQYLAPSLQLLCGVALYGEPFNRIQQIGFGLIWIALLIYAVDGLQRMRRN